MTYNIELTKEQQGTIEFITNELDLEAVVFHQVMAKDQFDALVKLAESLGLAKKKADLQEIVIQALQAAGYTRVESLLESWADDMGNDPEFYYKDGCQSQHISSH